MPNASVSRLLIVDRDDCVRAVASTSRTPQPCSPTGTAIFVARERQLLPGSDVYAPPEVKLKLGPQRTQENSTGSISQRFSGPSSRVIGALVSCRTNHSCEIE